MFEPISQHKKLLFSVIPFVMVLLIFVNSSTAKSPFVGFSALVTYLIVNGEIFGRFFFREETFFFRSVFGLFAFLVVLALAGILAIFILPIESWYLLGLIAAAALSSILNLFFVKHTVAEVRVDSETKLVFSFSHVLYGVYFVLLISSCYLLISVRSGWVRGPIWNIISPAFFPLYLAATAVLVAIAFLAEKNRLNLLLIVLHSTFSLLFIVIVSDPGIILYDPWYDLGRARGLLAYVQIVGGRALSFRMLNTFLRGLSCHVLISTFAVAFSIDVYWVYVFFLPILWGFFVPIMVYKIARTIGGCAKTAILAAFLTIPNLFFLAWGKLTEATSFGILFFIFFLYLVLRFLSSNERSIFFLIFTTFVATLSIHLLPAMMCLSSMLLALVLKRYKRLRFRFPKTTHFLLLISFIVSILLLPMAVAGRGIILPMLGTSFFSIDKLLGTDIWSLIFGFSGELTVQETILYEVFPILGIIGFVYALQKEETHNKTLCWFSFLGLAVTMFDFRIMKYGMVGHIFGPGRIKVFRDMFAFTFVAVVVKAAAESLFGGASRIRSILRWRRIAAGTLICLCLSSWTTLAIYETYESYTGGLLPTSLEVEAVKYIDEHADGRYVVLAPHRTAVISWGFIGVPNLDKNYVSLGIGGNPTNPSVADMYQFMRAVGADVGYYMVTSFAGANIDRMVAEVSQNFGLFKVLSDENGEIYIFKYKIPPLPDSANVTAFYWDTPPTYYVQNDLMRVIVNPEAKSLGVMDFWGSLYESVKLNETLVDGSSLGNLTSIEYFDVADESWVEWTPDVEIPPVDQFTFNLRFETESLVVVVERDKPSVELQWESGHASTLDLQFGDFTHLYIPGLMDGKNSYDIFSREYGFLYTVSLTDNATLSPIDAPNVSRSTLAYSEILEYCRFNLTQSHMSYGLYIENNEIIDQWTFVEVWLPDEVYVGTFPPLQYSLDDGKTWVYVPYSVEERSNVPITTIGGIDINWIFTIPRSRKENPTMWWTHTKASGGNAPLPLSYTESGGAQNRMFFGFYLPAKDKILVKLGCSVYYARPLELTYRFIGSENIYYGLHNMERSLVGVFNVGPSEYMGGFALTALPTWLDITQDENGRLKSIRVAYPSLSLVSLLSGKDVDTRTEIPDFT